MFNSPSNPAAMSKSLPGQYVPIQGSQNNFQMFQQPPTGSSHMQPSPSNIYNPQDQQKHPSYQFYQGEAFHPARQNPTNVQPPSNLCQPIFQIPYNTPSSMPTQQIEALPQSIVDQIRACVGSAAPPIFILPGGGCHQSTSHQQAERTPDGSQSGMPHAPGHQLAFNYPPASPVYCSPPLYPYPIPLPVYEPSLASAAGRSKVQICDCQKLAGLPMNARARGQCHCDVECSEHRCTPTTDDTICSKMNCPSSINLQALASQLLSVPGIISCAATRLILRKIPGSNITSTLESTMDTAQRSIGALTKDQLVTESRIAQQVTALINLHMNNNPPANIVPVLTLIQLKVNLLKAQVDSLINRLVMEGEGCCAAEVDSASPLDPMILARRSDSELRRLLSALRQKECDERVNVNYAPYHSQRAIAEARFNRVQNKIRQVEAELEKRRTAALPTYPITDLNVPTRLPPAMPNAEGKYPLIRPTVNTAFYESPDPFAVKLRNPKRLMFKPHVGCPETTYNNPASSTTSENQVLGNESKATETQKQETEDKSNATSAEQQNQTNEEAVQKYPSREECVFCSRQMSDESVEEDKKKLGETRKAKKAIAVISSDKLRNRGRVVSSNKIAIEKDDTGLTSETNEIDPGCDEVTSDTGSSKVHWLSKTFDLNLTKQDKVIGAESGESLHNPVKRETMAITEKIESMILMGNGVLKRIEYKDSKEENDNEMQQLTTVAVKQEQTEPQHEEEGASRIVSFAEKKSGERDATYIIR